MSTLKTQYQNYLKDNNLLIEHVTYDYWLYNIFNNKFSPFISDDFQIGSDGAYEHKEEGEPQTQLEELNDYLRMLADMDNIRFRRKIVLLERYINILKNKK